MKRTLLLSVVSLLCLVPAIRPFAQTTRPSAAWLPLDGEGWKDWSGIERAEGAAAVRAGAEAVYRVPDGPRGAYRRGLYEENDGTLDVRQWYGIRFEVEPERDDVPLAIDLTIAIPPQSGRQNFPASTAARAQVVGRRWQTVTVPIESFDFKRGQSYFLKYAKQISLRVSHGDRPDGGAKLRNVRLVRGNVLAVDADIRGAAVDSGGQMTYAVNVTNCDDVPRLVGLTLRRKGWEGMTAEVSPAAMSLQPGESKAASVRVTVPAELPAGGQEKHSLVVSPQDGSAAAETVEFTTLRRLPHPYILHTAQGWDDVRAKTTKYDWAKEEAVNVIKSADAFEVPVVPPGGIPSDQGTQAVYKSYIEQRFAPVVVAWKLTGEKRHGEKIALFLRRFADPENGYPVTLHAVTQGIPQEGGFFETAAAAYDAIRESELLTDTDRRQIEHAFRLYIQWNVDGLGNGGISNWSLFNLCPAAMCALAIQDMHLFDTLMNGQGGIIDHLRYGMMDDGWWYEMSLSYNLGCAEVVTKLAIAARPFGIDLLNQKIPASLTKDVGLRPFEYQNLLGMAFGKYGPMTKNTITLKMMWDGITAYPDYRGMMFGMGDGHEQNVSGGPFELAYYAFGDPAYAAVLKRGNKRDLVYGVPELPEQTPELFKVTAKSDNAGIAVLRSQTPGREPREQIQAAFKYGAHGSYHGHFDRISFLSLMRYGRSFYNPETSWFGYGSYMYKWWVQVSLSHSMVVVDGKMQEPKECRTLLFHGGQMMQAVAAETNARWSHPPYFGGYEQIGKVKTGDAPFVPVPDGHPASGAVTGFTEPVRQRRLMVVTDDYVVVADDVHGQSEHTFDNLVHLRGARLADPGAAKFLGHEAQFDADPLSSGQFITNVARYEVGAPALVHSIHRVGGGKNWETGGQKSRSVPGVLHIDEHVLWPQKAEVAIGDYAESWPVGKKLSYDVKGDGRELGAGAFGAWMLGSNRVDVDVTGVKTLQLSTRTSRGRDTRNTVFWGSPTVVTADGKQMPLDPSRLTVANGIPTPKPDSDYEGGPVRIAGTPFANSVGAEPKETKDACVISVDLAGVNAVRFKAVVGGDWPVGDEEQLRKVVSVRVKGKSAQFLTLIEPFEEKRMVKSAVATGPGKLRVELTDGRSQELTIEGLDSAEGDIVSSIVESRDGQVIRSETTHKR